MSVSITTPAETIDAAIGKLSYQGGAGLHKLLFHGEVNAPGVISLTIIIGVIIFMYWAIRYR